MKFQKDNSVNRLTPDIIEAHKQEVVDRKKRQDDERKRQVAITLAQKPMRDRVSSYPDLKEQLDMLWHDMDEGRIKLDKSKTDTWYQRIKKVKESNPLPDK